MTRLVVATICFLESVFKGPAPQEQGILLISFAVAHTSQFLINVPIAKRGGRKGESYWDVLEGPMLFIFVVDGLMMLVNFSCAALVLS